MTRCPGGRRALQKTWCNMGPHARRRSIWIGFDPRPSEVTAFAVARMSIQRRMSTHCVPINGIALEDMRARGMYYRPTKEIINEQGKRQLIDELSIRPDYNGGMSTEFAMTRFLTPHLAEGGLALFCDCDMLFRDDVNKVFQLAEENPQYAVLCVKHDHRPKEKTKMDGQVQSIYDRKNWSSFMIFRCEHPANQKLTIEMINTLPGRDLHGFCWLEDHEIGELHPKWNWLAGYSDPKIEPSVVHWTAGTPFMEGYEDTAYADEGRTELLAWAA